jgi:hypothetical protein
VRRTPPLGWRWLPIAMVASSCGIGNIDPIEPPAPSVGLVAYWTFDEGQGALIPDHSGNGYDGTLTGGAWVSAGHFGGGLSLQRGDYVTVPNFPNATSSWTVSVWTAFAAADIVTERSPLLSTEIAYVGGWELHAPGANSPPQFEFSYARAATVDATMYVLGDCCPIVTGPWTHTTAVLDGERSTLTMYEGGTARLVQPVNASIRAGDSTLYLGRWGGAPARTFQGTVDDIRIYNRALAPSEILGLELDP